MAEGDSGSSEGDSGAGGGEKYTFFWQSESPFSQWFPCKFTVDGIEYSSAEQYMMHQKAVLFKDEEIAEAIMKSPSPRKQKSLGRKVKNFDGKAWNEKCRTIVKNGNIAKFSQNEDLKKILLDTSGTTLVEASPLDTIWGIGYAEDHPNAKKKSTWNGKNWLGYALTEARDEIVKMPCDHVKIGEGESVTKDEIMKNLCNNVSKAEAKSATKKKKKKKSRDNVDTAEGGSATKPECSEKYTFFWKPESPFSQWYPCKFTVDGTEYSSAEQYMMHQKAVLFGDTEIADAVLKSDSPKEQKSLGRKVKDFDENTWNENCRTIVRKGNVAKFSQNEDLKKILLDTSGTTLAEASPVDCIWGIGYAKDHPKAKTKSTWRGTNWLGYALTEAREEIEKAASASSLKNEDEREKLKEERKIRKKLKQITALEERQKSGEMLTTQETEKIAKKTDLQAQMDKLQGIKGGEKREGGGAGNWDSWADDIQEVKKLS